MENKENSENNFNKNLFYGVSLPSDVTEEDVKLVFDNMKDTSAAVKRYKGSRFKVFDNINDAILFSNSKIISKEEDPSDVNQINRNIEKNLSPYNGLHPRDLTKLRKAIESNDFSTVKDLIESNPRYLVSSCDTPSILMEGPRYNASHIAAKSNRPDILRYILNTVSDKQFWKKLYPFDKNEITESRIKFLLDLYLNNSCSERASCDSPLHLGCKWGSYETVSVLLSYANCDTEKANKLSQKASQLICERKGDSKLKTDIQKLFDSRIYIPLIRNDLRAQIGKPFKGSIEMCNLSEGVTAVAGPMSPDQAERLYQTLKSPHKCTENDRKIRLTDSRKGLERIARNLCKELDINWEEFWPFLNIKIDLTSDEGLMKLEKHLRNVYCDLDIKNSEDSHDLTTGCSDIMFQMSKLSLNSNDLFADNETESQESTRGLISDINQDLTETIGDPDFYECDDDHSFSSALSSPTFLYEFYINGSEITREDIDAALALQDIIESDRCLKYDFIQDWFRRVKRERLQYFNHLSFPSTPNK